VCTIQAHQTFDYYYHQSNKCMIPYHPYQITRRVAKMPKSPGRVRVPSAKAKETLLANEEANHEQAAAASWATSEVQYRRLIELLTGMLEDYKETSVKQAEASMTQIEAKRSRHKLKLSRQR